MVLEFLPLYPPAASSTLKLLNKLDAAFASLATGKNVESGVPLPGFEQGSVVSMTEKVRIKSIVDQTMIVAVRVLGDDYETVFTDEDEEDGEDEMSDFGMGAVTERDMRIAKVYERTIGILGKELGGSPIGMITNE
jgi:hypothetical protein